MRILFIGGPLDREIREVKTNDRGYPPPVYKCATPIETRQGEPPSHYRELYYRLEGWQAGAMFWLYTTLTPDQMMTQLIRSYALAEFETPNPKEKK